MYRKLIGHYLILLAIFVVVPIANSYSAEKTVHSKSQTEAAKVSKSEIKGLQIGPSYDFLFQSLGIGVDYRKTPSYSFGLKTELGPAVFTAEGHARYYPFSPSWYIHPYLSGGLLYLRAHIIEDFVRDLSVALVGKEEEVRFHFLGPSLKLGFDIPIISRIALNVEGGVAYLVGFSDASGAQTFFPTPASLGLKFIF